MLEEILFLLLLKEIQDSDIITRDTIDIEIIDLSIIMEDIIQDIKDKIGLEEIEEAEEEDFKLKDYLFVSHWNEWNKKGLFNIKYLYVNYEIILTNYLYVFKKIL